MSRKLSIMIARSIAVVCLWALTAPLSSQAPQPKVIVFRDVRIFDGRTGQLSGPSHVSIRGNKIERISSTPIAVPRGADATLIEGGGRTLMPGLIDVHWHAMLVRPTPAELVVADVGYMNLVAGAEATDTLMKDGRIFKNTLPRH